MIYMIKRIFLLVIVLMLLQGCAGKTPNAAPNNAPAIAPNPGVQEQPQISQPSSDAGPQGFLFEAYSQNIYVCAEAAPILAALPEPRDTFESPSCAFEGMDITYFYPGFELTTYPKNNKEYVLSIVFTDDSITTPDGIYLGGTLQNVEKAYGVDYERSDGQITYSRGKGSLIFTFEQDIIVGIVYTMIIEEIG